MIKSVKEVFQSDKVDIIEIFQLYKSKYLTFTISLGLILFLGIVKTCSSPTEYEAVSTKLSELESGSGFGMRQMEGLSKMTGVNLPALENSMTPYDPSMYPQLVTNKSFLLSLINEKFYFVTKGRAMSLKEYYLEENPNDAVVTFYNNITNFPQKFFSFFEKNNKSNFIDLKNSNVISDDDSEQLLKISQDDIYVMGIIKDKIKIESEGRMINLSVKMPEAVIAAEMNNIIFEKILDYVTAYKTEKQRNNLMFIEERTKEAEENFKKSQINLAVFRDINQGVLTQRAFAREEQLQSEFNMAFSLYSNLRQELENTKIQLKRETPLFSDFDKVVIPNEPVNRSLLITIIIYLFLGLVVGFTISSFLLLREFII